MGVKIILNRIGDGFFNMKVGGVFMCCSVVGVIRSRDFM